MRFISLKLNNFMPYLGENIIKFAENSITLILGENGTGKTAITQAIMFCLYGNQFFKKDGLIFVNTKLLEQNEGRKEEAFVELEFGNNGIIYKLKRSVLAQRNKNLIVQNFNNTSLIIDEKTLIQDSERISNVISGAIDGKRFLFSSERIKEITSLKDNGLSKYFYSESKSTVITDSPFVKFSESAIDTYLRELSILLGQWILLVHPYFELKKDKILALRTAGKLGEIYEIQFITDRESIIVLKDLYL